MTAISDALTFVGQCFACILGFYLMVRVGVYAFFRSRDDALAQQHTGGPHGPKK